MYGNSFVNVCLGFPHLNSKTKPLQLFSLPPHPHHLKLGPPAHDDALLRGDDGVLQGGKLGLEHLHTLHPIHLRSLHRLNLYTDTGPHSIPK